MERASYRFRHSALGEVMQTFNDVNERARNNITDELLPFRDDQRLSAARRTLAASDVTGQLEGVATLMSAATARMLNKTLQQVLDQQRHMVSAMAKAIDQAIPLVGEVSHFHRMPLDFVPQPLSHHRRLSADKCLHRIKETCALPMPRSKLPFVLSLPLAMPFAPTQLSSILSRMANRAQHSLYCPRCKMPSSRL